jgi:hypothetical protein
MVHSRAHALVCASTIPAKPQHQVVRMARSRSARVAHALHLLQLAQPCVVDFDLCGRWEQRAPHRTCGRRLWPPKPCAVTRCQQLSGAVVVLDHTVEALLPITSAKVSVVDNHMTVNLPCHAREIHHQPIHHRLWHPSYSSFGPSQPTFDLPGGSTIGIVIVSST